MRGLRKSRWIWCRFHFFCELARNEWLLDEVDVFVEKTMRRDDLGVVAGHEEAGQVRAVLAQALGQFATVEAWEDHVGDKQVEDVRHARGRGWPGKKLREEEATIESAFLGDVGGGSVNRGAKS